MNRFARNTRTRELGQFGGLGVRTYAEAKEWYDDTIPVRGRQDRGLPWAHRYEKALMFHHRDTEAIEFYGYYGFYRYVNTDGSTEFSEYGSRSAKVYPNNTWVIGSDGSEYERGCAQLIRALFGFKCKIKRNARILWINNGNKWYAVNYLEEIKLIPRKGFLVPVGALKVKIKRVNRKNANSLYSKREERLRVLVGRYKLMYHSASPEELREKFSYTFAGVRKLPIELVSVNAYLIHNNPRVSAEAVTSEDMYELIYKVRAFSNQWSVFGDDVGNLTPALFAKALRYFIREASPKYAYRKVLVESPDQYRVYKF